MTQLDISLFGFIRVALDEIAVNAFRSDKTRALLAFLAVEARYVHSRDKLAYLLWPDQTQAAARTNLRQTLYRLRRSLCENESNPPHLLVNPNELQFNPHSDYWLDVHKFTQLIQACQAHLPSGYWLSEACLLSLDAAVDLYCGDFLDGFGVSDSPPFEYWMLTRRETYHGQAVEALAQLSAGWEFQGNFARASEYAQRAIELEPMNEVAHQLYMRSLAFCGQRHAALKQFNILQKTLSTEIGIGPSVETVQLYEQIRSGASLTRQAMS